MKKIQKLFENELKDNYTITKNDIQELYNNIENDKTNNWNIQFSNKSKLSYLKMILEDPIWLTTMSEVYTKIINIIKQKNSSAIINERTLKLTIIFAPKENYDDEKSFTKVSDYFPIPVYIGTDNYNSIGLMVHENGKLEMFEGNDEANAETIQMINKILYDKPMIKQIWGSHNSQLVLKIKDSGILPKDIYVSPSKSYAEGYLDLEGNRSLFSGFIDIRNVNQESDVDWKILEPTKIDKMRIF
jgi:hypothetical protein